MVVHDFVKGVIVPGCFPASLNVYEKMINPIITVPAGMDIPICGPFDLQGRHTKSSCRGKRELIGMISFTFLILNETIF